MRMFVQCTCFVILDFPSFTEVFCEEAPNQNQCTSLSFYRLPTHTRSSSLVRTSPRTSPHVIIPKRTLIAHSNQYVSQTLGSMESHHHFVPPEGDSTLFEWASLPERARQLLRDLYNYRQFNRINVAMPPMTFKETSSVFIPTKLTSHLISNHLIQEQFASTKRLFQFLNWTMRINKSTQNMVVMEGRNGCKVLLFDVELHDPRCQSLYALCTPNITQTPKAQPWRLEGLLTADMITKWMDIDSRVLPRGVRAVSPHFEQYRKMKDNLQRVKRDILEIDAKQNGTRYCHLRCIRAKLSTESPEKVMTVRFSTFYEIVQSALKNENVNLVPIVSIVSRKSMDSAENLLDFRFVFYWNSLRLAVIIVMWWCIPFRNDSAEYHSVLYIYSASTTYCRFKWMVIGSVWCIVTDNVLWHWWTTTISPIKRFNVILPSTFGVWAGSPTISIDCGFCRIFHENRGIRKNGNQKVATVSLDQLQHPLWDPLYTHIRRLLPRIQWARALWIQSLRPCARREVQLPWCRWILTLDRRRWAHLLHDQCLVLRTQFLLWIQEQRRRLNRYQWWYITLCWTVMAVWYYTKNSREISWRWHPHRECPLCRWREHRNTRYLVATVINECTLRNVHSLHSVHSLRFRRLQFSRHRLQWLSNGSNIRIVRFRPQWLKRIILGNSGRDMLGDKTLGVSTWSERVITLNQEKWIKWTIKSKVKWESISNFR